MHFVRLDTNIGRPIQEIMTAILDNSWPGVQKWLSAPYTENGNNSFKSNSENQFEPYVSEFGCSDFGLEIHSCDLLISCLVF